MSELEGREVTVSDVLVDVRRRIADLGTELDIAIKGTKEGQTIVMEPEGDKPVTLSGRLGAAAMGRAAAIPVSLLRSRKRRKRSSGILDIQLAVDPEPADRTKAAFAAMPRSRNLADEAQDTAGGLGEVLAVAAESQEADRGQAIQQTLLDFGAWVREQREARGWTLEQLAKKVGSTGPQISLVERGIGKRGPSLALIARILWAFDSELSFPLADS